jgi:hypothetical protein
MTFSFGDCEMDLERRELRRAKRAVNVGSHSWAKRYDRELADLFAVRDEITEAGKYGTRSHAGR